MKFLKHLTKVIKNPSKVINNKLIKIVEYHNWSNAEHEE